MRVHGTVVHAMSSPSPHPQSRPTSTPPSLALNPPQPHPPSPSPPLADRRARALSVHALPRLQAQEERGRRYDLGSALRPSLDLSLILGLGLRRHPAIHFAGPHFDPTHTTAPNPIRTLTFTLRPNPPTLHTPHPHPMTWEVDENGDGAIDWEEFQLMCAARRPQQSSVGQARAKWDTSRTFLARYSQPRCTHAAPTLHATIPAALT